MIEVHREEDDVVVLISGKELDDGDHGDDYVFAEIDLADMVREGVQTPHLQ